MSCYARKTEGALVSQLSEFNEGRSVKYVIRIVRSDGERADFVSSLEGFKKFGELLLALNSFAEEKLIATDTEKLKEVLTAENIKSFVKLKKAGKFIK